MPHKAPYGNFTGPPASVTYAGAEEIRRRRAEGERGLDLAAEFGVSPQIVCDIVHGRRRIRPDRAYYEAQLAVAEAVIRSLVEQLDPVAPYDQGEAVTAAHSWLRKRHNDAR